MLKPLQISPTAAGAARFADRLANNPAYARLCLIQQLDGRWLVACMAVG